MARSTSPCTQSRVIGPHLPVWLGMARASRLTEPHALRDLPACGRRCAVTSGLPRPCRPLLARHAARPDSPARQPLPVRQAAWLREWAKTGFRIELTRITLLA